MLDFICLGSAELFGRGRERKLKIYICHQRDLKPTSGTLQQVNQRFRPHGHDGLTMICGLMSYRIVGYKLISKYWKYYWPGFYADISLEIVQTIGCLHKVPQSDGVDRQNWKNRNILELHALVTARGHTENGTVTAVPVKQRVRASFQQIHPSCELQNLPGLKYFHF